jgi:hypothetical protein
MTAEIQSKQISRRTAFSLIGAALSVALPATMLAFSEAEAQTAGTERRQARRDNRHNRRDARRDNRQDRRDARRDNRDDRRDARRGVSATTGSAR